MNSFCLNGWIIFFLFGSIIVDKFGDWFIFNYRLKVFQPYSHNFIRHTCGIYEWNYIRLPTTSIPSNSFFSLPCLMLFEEIVELVRRLRIYFWKYILLAFLVFSFDIIGLIENARWLPNDRRKIVHRFGKIRLMMNVFWLLKFWKL